ncbi:MAG: ABC transporter ATP-binding protein [Anaerolineales bacterium]|nr:ABC transporter ATP-binding protein [Anaerolineales bacterium]
MTIAIEIDHLSKAYRLGQIGGATLKEDLNRWWARARHKPDPYIKIGQEDHGNQQGEYIWALREISFCVQQGKVLGVIGRNGAGKSTLLKILSRITAPTSGEVRVKGRVASLLEVGTGFHPELTGRENVYLNGAILGMNRRETNQKFDEIVQFSEVEQFIDTPVKRYSSGMYVRLAFAVAAHLEPEILLVDEVLAVGDAEFQKKCLGKMSDVAQQGRTVLFVSHNMSAVLRLTEETILLDRGQLKLFAPTPKAVEYYMSSGFAQVGERLWADDEIPASAEPFRPLALRIRDRQGRIADTVRSTEPVTIEVEYRLDAPLTGLRIGLYLQTARGEVVFTSFDTDESEYFENYTSRPAGHYVSRCAIPADMLNEGRYALGINASAYRVKRFFQDEQALTFTVDATGAPGMHWPEPRQGPLRPRLAWQIERMDGKRLTGERLTGERLSGAGNPDSAEPRASQIDESAPSPETAHG